jgi:hypothetical protein
MGQRAKIGWLALALVAIGALMLTRTADSESAFAAACLRVGVVLGALWLAYADLVRIPPRLWTAGVAALVVMAARPRWWPVAVVVFVALLLAPRPTGRR